MKNFDAPFHCYLVLLIVGPIHQIHKINSNIAEFQYIEKHKKIFLILDAIKFGCNLYTGRYAWVFMIYFAYVVNTCLSIILTIKSLTLQYKSPIAKSTSETCNL